MTRPTTRVRLVGTDPIHATQPDQSTAVFTACGNITCPEDRWLPDTEPVTCSACTRILAREGNR
ncbi:hypothetical protein PUR59_00245 [Streptomyces sp. SP18ES09]|uniref:hypothetical protein n=1 Tax=Streptomyces sp. SP18ES09 TaxID=3002532 RepID=UPI002E765401|nr:hypothetical protein [Streptomyces sp. SP18ES09]MEE1813488.1 hypothetical protein [Streptomyces sp. SP18ES09]